MYGLIMSSDDVLSYSQQMKSLEHEVQTIFQEVNQRMSQMSSVWDSPASQSLLSQFQSLRPVFDSYVQALEEYAMYLNQTAVSYQENEQLLSNGLR